jgi:UDP-N-acetylmuramoylalanine-D-glutamate ligase
MTDLSGVFNHRERVLVVGLGRSGIASCAVLRARGATVYATDEKPPEELVDTIEELARTGVRFVAPADISGTTGLLTSCVLSPGVPLNNELVRRVQAARVPVYSEIEVAYRISKAPLVAVTGTKGKTSTTALIGAMFRRAGKTTHVGGNIGNALIKETFAAEQGDWVIAEVSSFQLESIRSFKPRIATILNLSPDHLDRYHSMDEYGEAKFRIFARSRSCPSPRFLCSDGTISATCSRRCSSVSRPVSIPKRCARPCVTSNRCRTGCKRLRCKTASRTWTIPKRPIPVPSSPRSKRFRRPSS